MCVCTVPESLETAQTFLVPLRVTSKARTPRRLFFFSFFLFAREEHCDSFGLRRLGVGIGMGVGWGGQGTGIRK